MKILKIDFKSSNSRRLNMNTESYVGLHYI